MYKISSQGTFDGACFLYSITNSYTALTGKMPSQKKWNEALKWIPFLGDFITDTGTVRYDEDVSLYKFTIQRLLKKFNPKITFSITEYPNLSEPKKIKNLIKQNSVVILNIESEHRVVAVDSTSENIQIACSSQLMENRENYVESTSEKYLRAFNFTKPIKSKKWIHTPSVFKITIVS